MEEMVMEKDVGPSVRSQVRRPNCHCSAIVCVRVCLCVQRLCVSAPNIPPPAPSARTPSNPQTLSSALHPPPLFQIVPFGDGANAMAVVKRLGVPRLGQPITVLTNHFKLQLRDGARMIYRYNIDIRFDGRLGGEDSRWKGSG